MVHFSAKELAFINSNEVARVATSSKVGEPHVVPVGYIFIDGNFYFATDYNTRKYRNIKANGKIALVIDTYKPNKAIFVQGKAEVIESGEEFRHLYSFFHKKFAWVRADPWTEGEAPFIKVIPMKKVSWGLGA